YNKSLGGLASFMDYGIYALPDITNLLIQKNLIAHLEVDGIYLETSEAKILRNEICFNGDFGLQTDSGTKYNLIQGNYFYCNPQGGVLLNGGNDGITAPTIASATPNTVEGFANAFETIEVFIHDDTNCPFVKCQGKQFVGQTLADAGGKWQLNVPYTLSPGVPLTATATDSRLNTSEFSACEKVRIDNCPEAALLLMNSDPCGRVSLTASLESSTASSPPPYPNDCANTYGNADIWFKVIVPTSGNLLLRTHSNTTIYASIEAYATCPTFAGPSPLKCQAMNIDPNVMTLTGQTPGNTIYLRIWEQNDVILNSPSDAIIELSAHELEANPDDWVLCDTPMAQGLDNNRGFGGGKRKANQFILKYTDCATPTDINLITHQLLAMGATLKDQCDCANPLLQLWGEDDPVNLEACKKAAAKSKARVSTTDYNYLIDDLDCQELQTTLSPINQSYDNIPATNIYTTSSTIIYEFAQTSGGTTNTISGYYEYDAISENLIGGYLSGFVNAYYFTGSLINIINNPSSEEATIDGTIYDNTGQAIAPLGGQVISFMTANNSTDIFLQASVPTYSKVPCGAKGTPSAYSPYQPLSTFYQVVVGVSDSGIEAPSSIFDEVAWTNPNPNTCVFGDYNGYNFAGDNELYADVDGHGSNVSGIISGGIPSDIDLDIMPLKFYENGTGTVFDGICSIHYATEKGADILNLSWGFEAEEVPEVLLEALDDASCHD
ncbi:MAG: S8 family serine peptidase, partial [Bacteroidota bacterium]